MSAKYLEKKYKSNKERFHEYVNTVKRLASWDLYTIINPTLIKNPYMSDFPLNFFKGEFKSTNKVLLFVVGTIKFYAKHFYLYASYVLSTILYKIFYRRTRKNEINTVVDVFSLVDKINVNGNFQENYLSKLCGVFESYSKGYTLLLRPYGANKNPFKLIKFFKILNNDKRDFILEYELLSILDFIKILWMVLAYPFKTLKLLQKEDEDIDKIFNQSLMKDIAFSDFKAFTRYILGKNIAKITSLEKIYSWSEFQVIERSFNYAVRTNNPNIQLIACQFFFTYDTYFNVIVDDIDFEMKSSPHKVLVNGTYYLQDRKNIVYEKGVSLRYADIFSFKGIEKEKNILLLGSYIESDTRFMLGSVSGLDNVFFKNHPAVDINKFEDLISCVSVLNDNIYDLFKKAKIVVTSASGTAVEAVACGLSVIVIASKDNLTANPLVEYGQGKIWDLAHDENDIVKIYNRLMKYRKEHKEDIMSISQWYRDNFFVEPTEANIAEVFGLTKGYNV